jgi:AraC-like DNA-binding protein
MRTDRTSSPARSLQEFVSAYVLCTEIFGAWTMTRPVTASPDVLLVFDLSGPSEAFEYRTGRTRVLPTTFVVGPQTGRRAELVLRGHRTSLVVRFRPGGFHRLFHLPVDQVTDTALDAVDVIGPEIHDLRNRLAAAVTDAQRLDIIETYLQGQAPSARMAHPVILAASTVLASHGTRRVADVIKESGLSARHFERSFREQMGVSPKLFARAARLEFALGLKRGNPTHTWTRVSQEAGYFDQTHFVKDFKALAGETPSTFPLAGRIVAPTTVRRPA